MRFSSKDKDETVERLQNRLRMNRIRHTKFRPGLANTYAKYFFEGVYVPNQPESESFATCNDMILKSGNYLKVFDKNRRPLEELVQFNSFYYKKVFGHPMPNDKSIARDIASLSPDRDNTLEDSTIEHEIGEDSTIDVKL